MSVLPRGRASWGKHIVRHRGAIAVLVTSMPLLIRHLLSNAHGGRLFQNQVPTKENNGHWRTAIQVTLVPLWGRYMHIAFGLWFWLQPILSWRKPLLVGRPQKQLFRDSIRKHTQASQQLHESGGIKLAMTQLLSESCIIWHRGSITVQYQQRSTQCRFNKRTFVKSSAGGNVNLCFT